MSLEYASRGLVGMLTPQANTTVEPEFNILWPRGVAMINARLMSGKASMTARLVDYFDNYAASLAQFANAPVGVVAAACTGASYLAGLDEILDDPLGPLLGHLGELDARIEVPLQGRVLSHRRSVLKASCCLQ